MPHGAHFFMGPAPSLLLLCSPGASPGCGSGLGTVVPWDPSFPSSWASSYLLECSLWLLPKKEMHWRLPFGFPGIQPCSGGPHLVVTLVDVEAGTTFPACQPRVQRVQRPACSRPLPFLSPPRTPVSLHPGGLRGLP